MAGGTQAELAYRLASYWRIAVLLYVPLVSAFHAGAGWRDGKKERWHSLNAEGDVDGINGKQVQYHHPCQPSDLENLVLTVVCFGTTLVVLLEETTSRPPEWSCCGS
jgi:hypothetical protein